MLCDLNPVIRMHFNVIFVMMEIQIRRLRTVS